MSEGPPSQPTATTATTTPNANVETASASSSTGATSPQSQQQQQAPPDSNKTALIIARSFIKAYYHTLSTTPLKIFKFYKSESQLSFAHDGAYSTDMTPSKIIPFSDIQVDPDSGLFLEKFQNATINFENGSIDVQMSANGGILLIVTGYMTLIDEDRVVGKERLFVHTFFLSHETRTVGKNKEPKKNYYVLNDVFRFLADGKEVKQEEDGEAVVDENDIAVKEVVEEVVAEESILKETKDETEDVAVEVEKDKDDLSEEDIEEDDVLPIENEIDAIVEEPPTPYQEELVALEENHQNEEIGGSSITTAPLDIPSDISSTAAAVASAAMMEESIIKDEHVSLQPSITSSSADTALFPSATSKSKPPGSWASLVAGGAPKSTPSSSQQSSVVMEEKKTGKKDTSDSINITPGTASTVAAAAANVPVAAPTENLKENQQDNFSRSTNAPSSRSRNSSSNVGRSGNVRYNNSGNAYSNADSGGNKPFEPSSLYIKNIGDDLKESDLRTLFGAYGHKIVNINLYPSRGFAFVDFAEPAAVTDIMKEPRSFIVNGRSLEVEKKSGERRSGGGASSSSGSYHHRGGNNGMSSSMGGGRGGGRSSYTRRPSPRGDNRDARRSDVSRTRSSSGGERRRRGPRGQRGAN